MICISQQDAQKLREGIKSGDIDIAKLIDMTTAERKGAFLKYVSKDTAEFANKKFEQAMLSSRKTALADWVKKTFGKQTVDWKKDVTEKIDGINELLESGQQFEMIEDIIADDLGVRVSEKEIQDIIGFSKELKTLKEKSDKWGNPSPEYFAKRRELIKYLNKTNPSSNLDVAIGVVGRGSMLFSLKSPLLNIESNTVFGALGTLERRLMGLKFNGPNSKEMMDFIKHNTKLYAKTGTDLIAMDDLNAEYKVRGEEIVHSEGKGPIRKYGRFMETYSFQYGQGVPDIFMESFHFADYLNIETYKMAQREGLKGNAAKERSLELMKDAMKIAPATDEGVDLRQKARAEAMFYTYKNQSNYTRFGVGSRQLMNTFGKVFGVSKLGEAFVPFVKTTSNVVGAGVDFSGGYLFKGANELRKAYTERKIESISKEHLKTATKYFLRQGLGAALVAIIASMIDDENYMPDYYSASESEKSFARQYKIPYNSIKIGNRWVSFDYFGPTGAPLKAFIHARKYGDTPAQKLSQYGQAVLRQIFTFPGFNDMAEFIDKSKGQISGKRLVSDIGMRFYNGTIDFVSSRFIPAIISDFAKAIDSTERESDGIDKVTVKIPGLRNTAEESFNIFGDTIKTESFLSTMFLGSRVRTVRDDNVYNEIERLLEQGELPSIGDIEYASSRVKLMQQALGEKEFTSMVAHFGKNFRADVEKEIGKRSYQRMTDEEKKDRINKIKSENLDATLTKFKYKKIKKQSEKGQ